ncbi:ABC transporter permease subunit, partial [Streptococcus pneumoniae]|uniref:ABC transporter permease subunit n=1 Tax=Streptococcus pneumoniae TaxID=1313 RepID=UPI000A4F857A
TLEGYINVFTKLHVFTYFWNSFKVVSISVIISIVMISMSSYVIARMEFRGKKLVTSMLYSTLFIPATAMTKELEEAAEIDGATYAQTFWKVMLPIARPGILTAAVLAFINNWNEYYWASMLVIDKNELTVPALLGQFTTSFNTNYN